MIWPSLAGILNKDIWYSGRFDKVTLIKLILLQVEWYCLFHTAYFQTYLPLYPKSFRPLFFSLSWNLFIWMTRPIARCCIFYPCFLQNWQGLIRTQRNFITCKLLIFFTLYSQTCPFWMPVRWTCLADGMLHHPLKIAFQSCITFTQCLDIHQR